MAKKKKDAPRPAPVMPASHPLHTLLADGQYRAARAEAKRLLADPGASEDDRAVARDVLQRTELEPGALLVGCIAFAVILVVIALLYVR